MPRCQSSALSARLQQTVEQEASLLLPRSPWKQRKGYELPRESVHCSPFARASLDQVSEGPSNTFRDEMIWPGVQEFMVFHLWCEPS